VHALLVCACVCGGAQARSSAPLLRLDVWDYDMSSAHDFLGQKLLYEIDLLR
jgi:hypothetical protein